VREKKRKKEAETILKGAPIEAHKIDPFAEIVQQIVQW
jgi:hypothetical protein